MNAKMLQFFLSALALCTVTHAKRPLVAGLTPDDFEVNYIAAHCRAIALSCIYAVLSNSTND